MGQKIQNQLSYQFENNKPNFYKKHKTIERERDHGEYAPYGYDVSVAEPTRKSVSLSIRVTPNFAPLACAQENTEGTVQPNITVAREV